MILQYFPCVIGNHMGKRRSKNRTWTEAKIDNWWETSGSARAGTGDRKALQLSRQIERALGYILGDLNCDSLSNLIVNSVAPAPNASRLLVTVSCLDQQIGVSEILSSLHSAYGQIRREVATSIHRKRVPELVFQCVGLNVNPRQNDQRQNDQLRLTNDRGPMTEDQ
jgi:ribosome-binding factor A